MSLGQRIYRLKANKYLFFPYYFCFNFKRFAKSQLFLIHLAKCLTLYLKLEIGILQLYLAYFIDGDYVNFINLFLEALTTNSNCATAISFSIHEKILRTLNLNLVFLPSIQFQLKFLYKRLFDKCRQKSKHESKCFSLVIFERSLRTL